MSKYINADLLRAEIESRKDAILSCPVNGIVTLEVKSAIQSMAKGLLFFLDSLQQEQPDKETILRICKLHKVWSIVAPWENVEDFITTNWNSENIV